MPVSRAVLLGKLGRVEAAEDGPVRRPTDHTRLRDVLILEHRIKLADKGRLDLRRRIHKRLPGGKLEGQWRTGEAWWA